MPPWPCGSLGQPLRDEPGELDMSDIDIVKRLENLRVVAEKDDLHEKLIKLDRFIGENEAFGAMDEINRKHLEEQREHMANYLEVLYLRIERFQK